MRPHPKLRRTIKWGGTAVTVLLVVVWIGSGWCWIEWRSSRCDQWAFVGAGRAFVGNYAEKQAEPDSGWHAGQDFQSFQWSAGWTRAMRGWTVSLPLWPVIVLALAITVPAWRLDTLARRRAKLNRCPTGGCGYDRTGLARDARCPECGAVPTGD